MTNDIKKIDKNLIFLKSSVIALGIVFVVALLALVMVKNRNSSKVQASKCSDTALVTISQNIERVEFRDNYIFVVTNPNLKTGEQEIVKIDANCGVVLSRIILQVSAKK